MTVIRFPIYQFLTLILPTLTFAQTGYITFYDQRDSPLKTYSLTLTPIRSSPEVAACPVPTEQSNSGLWFYVGCANLDSPAGFRMRTNGCCPEDFDGKGYYYGDDCPTGYRAEWPAESQGSGFLYGDFSVSGEEGFARACCPVLASSYTTLGLTVEGVGVAACYYTDGKNLPSATISAVPIMVFSSSTEEPPASQETTAGPRSTPRSTTSPFTIPRRTTTSSEPDPESEESTEDPTEDPTPTPTDETSSQRTSARTTPLTSTDGTRPTSESDSQNDTGNETKDEDINGNAVTLSKGALAGIVVGASIAGIATVAVIAYFFLRKRGLRDPPQPEPRWGGNQDNTMIGGISNGDAGGYATNDNMRSSGYRYPANGNVTMYQGNGDA